jgi:3-deoxy-manno-octulosonate cytidylyltransferase (CMP-KDO synthetase)
VKRIVVIPARYGSTRLPGKPLLEIGGKQLVRWVFEKAVQSRLQDGVLIATDDERIRAAAIAFGADVVMTDPACMSGTERVFEAIQDRDADIIVNLQGDEPFIEPSMIDLLFDAIDRGNLSMATLCSPITDTQEYEDPNTVKVVVDRSGFALYFSRAPIPFYRNREEDRVAYKHVGVYGFRRDFLAEYVTMERGILEETECLEQLRVLEHGCKIKVLLTEYQGFGIDTGEDIKRARGLLTG